MDLDNSRLLQNRPAYYGARLAQWPEMYVIRKILTGYLGSSTTEQSLDGVTYPVTMDGVPTIPVYLEVANESTPAIITINGESINTEAIEWADLATDFGNGKMGVELRLSTDTPGITKQYIGEDASTAYDALETLAPAAVATA